MSRPNIPKLILCGLLIFISGCIPASSSESLPESDHPYAINLTDNWTIKSEPGTTEIQIHFENLDLSDSDELIIYDQYGDVVKTYSGPFGSGFKDKNFWTDWYVGDILSVKLITDEKGTSYGFKIDNVNTRTGKCLPGSLPESYHNYANNFKYTWPAISKSGAAEIRIHFEKLDLSDSDELIIYDQYGDVVKTYSGPFGSGFKDKNFWTDWYVGDTLSVELITDEKGTDYGFKIDKGEIRNDENVTSTFDSLETASKYGFQDPTVYFHSIHNYFVDIAVTLNILKEEDNQSWIYKNIEWIFGGFGVSLVGAIWKILKKPKDEKPSAGKSNDEKPKDN